MKFRKDIEQIKQKINIKRENIPSDITDKALILALYYIEIEVRKRGGGLDRAFTDKFYELGSLIYEKKLIDIEDQSVTDEDIKNLREVLSQSNCLKHIKDKRDFDL